MGRHRAPQADHTAARRHRGRHRRAHDAKRPPVYLAPIALAFVAFVLAVGYGVTLQPAPSRLDTTSGTTRTASTTATVTDGPARSAASSPHVPRRASVDVNTRAAGPSSRAGSDTRTGQDENESAVVRARPAPTKSYNWHRAPLLPGQTHRPEPTTPSPYPAPTTDCPR